MGKALLLPVSEDANVAYSGSCMYDLYDYDFAIHTSFQAYYFLRKNVYSIFSDSFSNNSGRRWAILNLKDINPGDRLVFSFEPHFVFVGNNIILAYINGVIFNNDSGCFLSDRNGMEKFSHDPTSLMPRSDSTIGYSYDLGTKSITFMQTENYYHIALSLNAIPSMPRVDRL